MFRTTLALLLNCFLRDRVNPNNAFAMTDIQPWRLSAQLSGIQSGNVQNKPGLVTDPALSDNVLPSTAPTEDHPWAKRSLASLSALLNPHRAVSSASKPE